jgi:hypothetical protein
MFKYKNCPHREADEKSRLDEAMRCVMVDEDAANGRAERILCL